MLKDLCSDHDMAWDVGRLMTALCILAALFFTGWTVIAQGKAFDVTNFGVGVGGLLAGLGAYVTLDGKARKDTAEANATDRK